MSSTIHKISVSIDGIRSSNYDIEIDGTSFHLDNFSLHQSLLSQSSLSFTMRKGPMELLSDTEFAVCGNIIGKEITLDVTLDSTEDLSAIVCGLPKPGALCFKGVIVAATGSRNMGDYYINVQARSWDILLNDNPTCKSYEMMTLNDIVNDVIGDYGSHLDSVVDARYTEPIPYCVQYNETNYQFLIRLARRYGEWLYNDGERLVFGNMVKHDTVRLNYTLNDIASYNVDMQILPTTFAHVASSYNSYDANHKEGIDEMQRRYNTLSEKVFASSVEQFVKPTLQNLHSGGFADSDGRQTILDVSTKTQARGSKAQMLTYSGSTYSSKLRIGNVLIIEDNYISNPKLDTKSHVDQDEILITEIFHYFSDDDVYSNNFVGIPSACDYPPYSDTDVYPVASSCRAKVMDNEDPNNLGRVRVQFDWQAQLDDEMMTPWLRLSQPYAGLGKGFSFIPEIGEEVMIDFEGGNAERPFVKGTLYNGVDNPDENWLPQNNSQNQIKAIRTRNGHTIEIHDEGDNGYIRIYDHEKENYILTFSTDDKLIKLESTGNIELYAENDVIIHAGHDVNVSADNDMFLTAGHDMQRTADNDIVEHAGNDRTTTIDHNDSLTVEANQFITVNDNKDEHIAHKLQETAETIRVEAEDKMMHYSSTHHIKASDKMAVNAGDKIEIKANTVKVN